MRKSIKMSLGSLLVITLLLTAIVIPSIHSSNSVSDNGIHSSWYSSLQQYAQEHGTTVEQLTANWTADDWLRWYKYEGNPSWGSTNITDQFLATDWVKLPNSGNLTWGANYDYEYKYNATSDQLEMWHNGTLVSYLGSDDLWHYVSDRPNLTDLHHIVDREYVDHAVASLGARYYMVNTSSGISDYKLTQLSPPSGGEESVTKSSLADDDYIAGWISPDTSLNKLLKGVYNWHIYAEKTGGTKTLRLYWKLIERKSDTTETVIATSVISNEILNSKNSYILPLTLSDDYTLDDGSYVVGKIYADVSGSGSSPGIAIYFNGSSKSHWEIPINLEIFSDQFLKLDGSNANSDIDVSPYNLTVGNISAFNFKLPASYIIWKDGSTYYALNGSTGEIDYSGTDAATVIQNAIDSLSGIGGKIILKNPLNDEYTLSSQISISGSYITIEGENYLVPILKPSDSFPNNTPLISISSKSYVTFRNLQLFGNSVVTGQDGIYINGGVFNTLENVKIRDFTEHGIHVYGGTTISLRNIYIEGCAKGVFFDNIKGVFATNIVSEGNSDSGMIIRDTYRATFINYWQEHNTIYGIKFFNVNKNIHFLNGFLHHNGNADVYTSAALDNVIFENIEFSGVPTNYYIQNVGMGYIELRNCKIPDWTKVTGNIHIYPTSSGSSEITGDGSTTSFSISHGLATTPSQVLVTPTNSSMASATWWVSAKTSTTFTITFSTAPSSGTKLSFDWKAEV